MPMHRPQSIPPFSEVLACTDAKGKAISDASCSSGTHKTEDGVTMLKQRAESSSVIIVDSSSEEENNGDCFSEEDWSVDGFDLRNEELMEQIAQVEADEELARKLQEEINAEVCNFGKEEGQLEQRDSDPNITSFTRNELESDQHFSPLVPTINDSNLRRPETRFSGPEMEYEMWLLSELRKGFANSQMDPATRAELLKELETIYENSNDLYLPDSIYPGFYNDVYEDDAVDEIVAATDIQINNLPVSMVKGDNLEEICVVCLEAPSIGAIVRHLPCMHKFHKECVDTWLRMRNCCPICKLAIN